MQIISCAGSTNAMKTKTKTKLKNNRCRGNKTSNILNWPIVHNNTTSSHILTFIVQYSPWIVPDGFEWQQLNSDELSLNINKFLSRMKCFLMDFCICRKCNQINKSQNAVSAFVFVYEFECKQESVVKPMCTKNKIQNGQNMQFFTAL